MVFERTRTRDIPPPLPRGSLIKIPRQARSIDTVHAILDAGIQVLEREGVELFSTNRVAEVAGVSPGSLYQYFANKEMILTGIVERGVLDAEATIQAAVRAGPEVAPRILLGQLLHALLVGLEPYRPLLAEILAVTPILSGTGVAAILETRLGDALRDFLVLRAERYTLRGGTAAIYVAVNGAIYVSLKWLAERPAHVSREELVELFISQIDNLIAER